MSIIIIIISISNIRIIPVISTISLRSLLESLLREASKESMADCRDAALSKRLLVECGEHAQCPMKLLKLLCVMTTPPPPVIRKCVNKK